MVHTLHNTTHLLPAQAVLSLSVCLTANVFQLTQAAAISSIALKALMLVGAAALVVDGLKYFGQTRKDLHEYFPLSIFFEQRGNIENSYAVERFLGSCWMVCTLTAYYFFGGSVTLAQFGLLCALPKVPFNATASLLVENVGKPAMRKIDAFFEGEDSPPQRRGRQDRGYQDRGYSGGVAGPYSSQGGHNRLPSYSAGDSADWSHGREAPYPAVSRFSAPYGNAPGHESESE